MSFSSEAEITPVSPDQVNACVGSVSRRRGHRHALRLLLLATCATNAFAWEDNCQPFKEIYADGKELCEIMWGDAFEYSTDEENAYTMWWFGENNPNEALARKLNKTVPDVCHLDYYHLDSPAPLPDDATECHPWGANACCDHKTILTAEKIKESYGPGYEWDRCGPMSPECARFFVQEACLYECDVTAGLYRKCSDAQVAAAGDDEDDPCYHNEWEMYKMPIKASYCDAWWQACRNDRFCGGAGGNFFECESLYWEDLAEEEAAKKAKAEEDYKAAVAAEKAAEELAAAEAEQKKKRTTTLVVIIVIVALFFTAVLVFMISRERKGKPVFEPLLVPESAAEGSSQWP